MRILAVLVLTLFLMTPKLASATGEACADFLRKDPQAARMTLYVCHNSGYVNYQTGIDEEARESDVCMGRYILNRGTQVYLTAWSRDLKLRATPNAVRGMEVSGQSRSNPLFMNPIFSFAFNTQKMQGMYRVVQPGFLIFPESLQIESGLDCTQLYSSK